MEELEQQGDSWRSLLAFTSARIALGRKGVSLPLSQVLAFKMAHAKARDAVFEQVDWKRLEEDLHKIGASSTRFHSKASDRHEYLLQPGKGRSLNTVHNVGEYVKYDISFVIADGLSAKAVNAHAIPLLELLKNGLEAMAFSIAPVSLVEQGRVGISDDIGWLWGARLVLILIGERPGLSSADSLGVYLTYNPSIGNTDEKRNCISNIRPEGLGYQEAAGKILFLVNEAMKKGLSGVGLKQEGSFELLK